MRSLSYIKNKFIWSSLPLLLLLISCIEPVEIESLTFEDLLVVEATITDEFKNQKINLSRTYELEEDGPLAERNAVVTITDDLQNTYRFEEASPGEYISVNEFEAIQGRQYQLNITTSNGREYASSQTVLTNSSQIDEVLAFAETNEDGVEGVAIKLNSFNPQGNSNFYRYEYEETYKIIAQNWSQYRAIVVSDTFPYEVDTVFKTTQDQICFKTRLSTGILQTETNSLEEDRVSNLAIRFIPSDDPKVFHRYSINVRQYVQSAEAFAFYKVLNELSSSESLFSQNQPGFINGNLFSLSSQSESVMGFFEVSSVSTKRIFFDRREVLGTGPPLGPCRLLAPELTDRFNRSPLIESIQSGSLRFLAINDGVIFEPSQVDGDGPYVMVPEICGDCTVSGGANSNIKPDFWID